VNRALDIGTSTLATVVRGGAGLRVGALGPRPAQRLRLYEFEGCPYCRKVREALSSLDLEAEIRPCPKGGTRFRPEVEAHGGRLLFPYLVDPGAGKAMYESDDIVAYLFEQYGAGRPPFALSGGLLNDVGSTLASALRPTRGVRARPSRAPARPLELYSFEASPFCRIAREALCSLELPYVLHNVAKGSPGREAFVARSGRMLVPWLYDPNTDTGMFESADIAQYLETTYGAGSSST